MSLPQLAQHQENDQWTDKVAKMWFWCWGLERVTVVVAQDFFSPWQCFVICAGLSCVSHNEGLGALAAWYLLPVFCRFVSEPLWGKKINKALVRSYPSPSSPGESTSFRTWNQRGFQQRRLIKWAWETGNKLSGLLNQISLLLYWLQ